MKIAFLGLGVMGYPMAGHLQKAGNEVTVYNRNAAKAKQWVAEYGGKTAATPAEAAKGQEIVFCCVGRDSRPARSDAGRQWRLRAPWPRARCSSITPPLRPPSRANWRRTPRSAASILSMPRFPAARRARSTASWASCAAAPRPTMPRPKPVMARLYQAGQAAGPGGFGPAHQDGQPDLHRRHRAGHGRSL